MKHGAGESISDYALSFATSLAMLHFSLVAIAARVERTYPYTELPCHWPVCGISTPTNSLLSTLVRILTNVQVAKTSILRLVSVQNHSFGTDSTSTKSFVAKDSSPNN